MYRILSAFLGSNQARTRESKLHLSEKDHSMHRKESTPLQIKLYS